MYHFYYMQGNLLVNIVMLLVIVWSILWKCYSSWLAAKHNHKKWFVALVVLNTLGILDMIYVFGVLKKKWSDVEKSVKSVITHKLK